MGARNVSKILTQRAVDAAKPPKKGRTSRSDGLVPGLVLYVHSGGAKSARLLARINGKQENLDVGDAKLLTWGEIRAKAKGMLGQIANGENPKEAKQQAVRTASETVEKVAGDYIERYAKLHTRRWEETERQIAREIIPVWGRRPISSIIKRDINELMDAIVDRNSPGMANGVFATARAMFGWAVERGLIPASPFDRTKAPAPKGKRDRTPDATELALIWQAGETLGYPFGTIAKLLILGGLRREEVAGMRWSELNADRTLWRIPAERVKNGLAHTVPVTPLMRHVINGIPRLAGTDLVFSTTGTSSVSGFSRAKRTLDAEIARLNGGVPIAPFTLHDIRRGFASGLAKLGIQLPVIERLLNHTSGSFGGIVSVYQTYSFETEMRIALEAWSQHVALAFDAKPVLALRG